MSDDGQTLMYIQYNAVDPEFYRWHGGVVQQVPGSASMTSIDGLSSDGDQALFGATVYRASDGSTVTTGLRPKPVVMGSDGSVVGLSEAGFTSLQLSRWTRVGGLQELGEVPLDVNLVEFTSTPSQNVIAGVNYAPDTTDTAFRWTQAGGVEFGVPGLQGIVSFPFAVSGDGSTLTGYLTGQNGLNRLFFWTQSGGVVPLDVLPSGYVALGVLPGGAPRSEASLMSADGSVIVGTVDDGGPTPFYWNSRHGARSIQVALSSAGIDLAIFRAMLPD